MSAAALAPWITVDPTLYFDPRSYAGCKRRKRGQDPRLIVGHWTGGEAGIKHFDDDGARVAAVLANRVSPSTGEPMPLSIHFVIGGNGKTWQMADPGDTICFHASAVNNFSIGVEIVNAGRVSAMMDGRARPIVEREGRASLAFYDPQLESWLRLCELLTTTYGIAPEVPGRLDLHTGHVELYNGRIPQYRLRKFSGVIEHLHCSSTKPDAGMQLVSDLVARGGFSIKEV